MNGKRETPLVGKHQINKIVKLSIGLLFLSILTACTSKHDNFERKEFTYYKNGNKKKEIVYLSKDTSSYVINFYNKNGNILKKAKYDNNKLNGNLIYYHQNGNIENISHYKEDRLYGMNRVYSKSGELLRESLYLDGNQVFFHEILVNDKGMKKRNFYYVKEGQGKDIGQLVYDSTNNIIRNQSFYYKVIGEDTLTKNEIYNLEIEACIRNCDSSCYINVYIGDYNKNLTFKNKSLVDTVKSSDLKIDYQFQPKDLGYQLIMGRIDVMKKNNISDSTIARFFLYEDFFVKDN